MRLFLSLVLFFLIVSLHAQDTLPLNDGKYKVGRLTKNRKLKGYWSFYSASGQLEEKRFYKRGPKFIRYLYNAEGELINTEPHKYFFVHGTIHDVKTNKKVKYRYDLSGHQLKNSKGQRMVYYFCYGLVIEPGRFAKREDQYACKRVYIAGCVVNSSIVRRAAIHNFFVNLRQVPRFGFGWKEKFF